MTVASEPGVRTGAGALVAALEAHDVEVVFGLPGIHALPVWDALIGSPIRRIVVRHEQAAGFGAVGYARTGDRPGVYLTSTGPGAFNSLAALSEADASSAPVLHLTSQIPTHLVGANRGYLHESRGQSQAFAAVSRFHARPTSPEALVEAVGEAFRHMALDPGPTTIEVATDVMAAAVEPASPSTRGLRSRSRRCGAWSSAPTSSSPSAPASRRRGRPTGVCRCWRRSS